MSVAITIYCNTCGKSVLAPNTEDFPENWMRSGDKDFCDKCSERIYMEAVGADEPEERIQKVSHRGYEIFVSSEGIEYKNYYIMRESDGWMPVDGFEYNGESVNEMIDGFKGMVDREVESDDPFDEKWEEKQNEDKGLHKVEGGWSNVPAAS
jgi:hypothetical protein